MQDAHYFRSQAERCLEMARQVSDRRLAESLRLDAAQYFMRATEIEADTEPSAAPPRRDGSGNH